MAEQGVAEREPARIRWYRCRVSRQDLSRLNKRSDLKGFVQTVGFLAVLAATGALAVWSSRHWPWYATVATTFLHGTCWYFLINGFHELVHDSVFGSRWLNGSFLRIYSFLGWLNHHWFWASHMEHHKYTLHQPDDLEVVLPIKMSLRSFLSAAFIDPRWLYRNFNTQIRRALGNYNPTSDRWTAAIFPQTNPDARRKLIRWSRILLIGHGLIAGVSLALGYWMVPIVVTLTPAYGRWLQFLCNESQHVGLQDNVPDFRLCCRTIYLDPVLRFLYWHMNYHTEHHMYAAVPCYNLAKLHRLILPEMPPCPRGLFQTWRQIAGILKRQRTEAAYQYRAPVPEHISQGREAATSFVPSVRPTAEAVE